MATILRNAKQDRGFRYIVKRPHTKIYQIWTLYLMFFVKNSKWRTDKQLNLSQTIACLFRLNFSPRNNPLKYPTRVSKHKSKSVHKLRETDYILGASDLMLIFKRF